MDDLAVAITGPDGSTVDFSTTSDDAESLITVDRITTKYGTGHESAQLTLHRDPIKRFDDIDLLYRVSITAADGAEVFGGRVAGINPESGRTQINCAGLQSTAKDKQGVSMIFKDRSLERWAGTPLVRQDNLLTNNLSPADGQTVGAKLKLALANPPWSATGRANTESWYTAPAGCAIASLDWSWERTNTNWNTGDSNHDLMAFVATDEVPASFDASLDKGASASGTDTVTATTADRRFAFIRADYAAAYATADSLERAMLVVPVITGTHGMTTITPSSVLTWLVDNYCPGLTYDAESITEHTYEIPHLVMESVDAMEGWARANAFANWSVNVWGNKVHYGPDPSLLDPDFILDLDRGDVLDPEGQTIDDNRPINGVEVFYSDSLTGRAERVGPDDDYRLRSDDPENACNKMGVDRWGKLEISFPCAEDDAIQIGSVWFAEASTPDRVGSGTVVGSVLTSSGNEVPVSSIRAGHVLRYAHESVGRLVYATTYEPAEAKMGMKFDPAPSTLSALLERIGVAVTVAGGK